MKLKAHKEKQRHCHTYKMRKSSSVAPIISWTFPLVTIKSNLYYLPKIAQGLSSEPGGGCYIMGNVA